MKWVLLRHQSELRGLQVSSHVSHGKKNGQAARYFPWNNGCLIGILLGVGCSISMYGISIWSALSRFSLEITIASRPGSPPCCKKSSRTLKVRSFSLLIWLPSIYGCIFFQPPLPLFSSMQGYFGWGGVMELHYCTVHFSGPGGGFRVLRAGWWSGYHRIECIGYNVSINPHFPPHHGTGTSTKAGLKAAMAQMRWTFPRFSPFTF